MTRIERAGVADPGSLSKGGEEYHLTFHFIIDPPGVLDA